VGNDDRRVRKQVGDADSPTPGTVEARLIRLPVEPAERNGLRAVSHLMIDKITTVSKRKLVRRTGRLSDEEMVRVNRAVLVLLGLAGPSK
jgi:mRNA interferase MazF